MGSFWLLLHSIEPRHLTNKSHPRALWATGVLLIVEYYIHHIIDDDVMKKKHDLSGRDAHERSNRCAAPRRSSILGAGSWRPFLFDHIFRSMIFGQVMAKIRHGGGTRTVVAVWAILGGCSVWFVILGVTYAGGPKKFPPEPPTMPYPPLHACFSFYFDTNSSVSVIPETASYLGKALGVDGRPIVPHRQIQWVYIN